jgi:hypothetical protein
MVLAICCILLAFLAFDCNISVAHLRLHLFVAWFWFVATGFFIYFEYTTTASLRLQCIFVLYQHLRLIILLVKRRN